MTFSTQNSFETLKHALQRRSYDFKHFLSRPQVNMTPLDFDDLAQQICDFEDALNHAPPVIPPATHARMFANMRATTADAVNVGKEIELNPFRVSRRVPSAKSKDVLRALRIDKYQQWSRVFQEIETTIKPYWDKDAEASRMSVRRMGNKL